MISDYNSLPDDAKVWVFPSQKKLYANEIESIEKKISDFILEWENENEDLTATFTIKYNRFIVLFAETETTISTKTTNELISFIIQLQTDLETELNDE